MKLLLKISIFALFCISFTPAFAQIEFQAPIDGVTIQSSNDNPIPGQTVNVSIDSYNTDLNSANVVWMVNNKITKQGVGLKSIDVVAPKIGSKTNVVVNIKSPNGKVVNKTYTITSGNVEIVWEPNGYVPPFFQGKLPFSYQNSVKLIAIPHLSTSGAKEMDPKSLVYVWKLGGKYIDGGQGYGKQSVIVTSDIIPKPLEISVDINNREGTAHASGNITINPSDPSLSFYEDDSLYGILFNKAIIDSANLKNSEMKIQAIPFGFNLNSGNTSYTWSINNIEQPDLIKNRSITIRTKGDTDGTSLVGIDIRNDRNILQGATGNFTVYFKKNTQ